METVYGFDIQLRTNKGYRPKLRIIEKGRLILRVHRILTAFSQGETKMKPMQNICRSKLSKYVIDRACYHRQRYL